MNVKLSKGIETVNFLLRKRKRLCKRRKACEIIFARGFKGICQMFGVVN